MRITESAGSTPLGAPASAAHRRAVAVLPAAAGLAALVGVTVLTGWTFGVPALTGHVAGLILTLPNTAVLFVLGALALVLVREEAGARAWRFARALGLFILLAGSLFLFERLSGFTSPIDTLLFGDALARYPYRPLGVPATNSCVCFVLFGSGMLLVDRSTTRGRHPSQFLASIGLLITGTALVGHLFGVRPLYAIDRFAGMAIPTAIGLSALLVGLLFARPSRGLVTLLTGDDLGAALLRRMLPATLLVPVVLGYLWIRARELDLVTREGGVSIVVVATGLVLFVTLLRAALALRATDRQRQDLLAAEMQARAEAQALASALEQRTEEAESASRAKSDFLATMSHELRTPLNAVIGYTQLLTDEVTGPLTTAQQAQLGRIRVSARHLLSLIEEILTLSRLEAGKETVVIERVSLEGLVHDAAAIVEPLASAKGLSFRSSFSGRTMVESDPGKLRQILVNLLSNAVKFTERGEVALTVSGDEHHVVCEVRDTGIGIDPEHLQRIFEPFWQVERAATRRAGGTGLGLGVSQRLARLLGGDITVESEPGRGSTFRVVLPVASQRITPPDGSGIASSRMQRV